MKYLQYNSTHHDLFCGVCSTWSKGNSNFSFSAFDNLWPENDLGMEGQKVHPQTKSNWLDTRITGQKDCTEEKFLVGMRRVTVLSGNTWSWTWVLRGHLWATEPDWGMDPVPDIHNEFAPVIPVQILCYTGTLPNHCALRLFCLSTNVLWFPNSGIQVLSFSLLYLPKYGIFLPAESTQWNSR